jgi:hypothetical protein
VPDEILKTPIGGQAIMHSHNTLPNMAQKYHTPIWNVPNINVENEDQATIRGNQQYYYETKNNYHIFASELLSRLSLLD